MQRQAVSIEPNVIHFHCSLTLWGKLALPGGRRGLVAPLCPQLPASCLCCTAGRACSLGLRWSTSRLWKQTKRVCFLHMETWLRVAERTASVGRPAPASASAKHIKLCCELDIVKWLCFHIELLYTDYKGVSISIPAFELRLNIQALWVPYGTGTVWKQTQSKAQRIATLCGSHAGRTAYTQTVWLLEN